jgi:hypothetical protein
MMTDGIDQDIGVEDMQLAHPPWPMNRVAKQSAGCPEGRDLLVQRAILSLEPLGFGFAEAKFGQEPFANTDTDVFSWAAIMGARRLNLVIE